MDREREKDRQKEGVMDKESQSKRNVGKKGVRKRGTERKKGESNREKT